ncbi:spermidine synthase [Paludisphaera mucosa]|uniref:Fused MFS/spermidine synthase n=1 Tax=Paludisphaera mucosa TaxID=3030827 RepID=A0ABT6FF87_9BACT|nr:fused MFS/spermidine synthase [Paludisphaera mucosa]MDG3006234.1 fused MFS/spermidine synthase [Paludisphaera mucosa]
MRLIRQLHSDSRWTTSAWALLLAVAATLTAAGSAFGACLQVPLTVELDEVSNYSHVKVKREGSMRTLYFVRDNGEEVIESQVDLKRPDDLRIPYTRNMFLSYILRPQPKRALLVGLGGGAMVHFLKIHDPAVKLDVVEIDPLIVSVADRFFGVKSGGNVDVKLCDGLVHLRESDAKYDIIYMDAFLRPSGGTDATGAPLHLKTLAFYEQVKQRLAPAGVVVFNLNPHNSVLQDMSDIRKAFPNTYACKLPNGAGFVVIASTAEKPEPADAIEEAATALDERFKAPFSFRTMARRLKRL